MSTRSWLSLALLLLGCNGSPATDVRSDAKREASGPGRDGSRDGPRVGNDGPGRHEGPRSDGPRRDGPVGPGAGTIIGIPKPPFGIDETAPTSPSPWSAEKPGFYCVNYTTGIDAGRPYGTPAAPRKTVPQSLPAGSVVEIQGPSYGGSLSVKSAGTAAAPVFIRGASPGSRPAVTADWQLGGTYLILENLHFGPTGLGIPEGNHHIAIRSCELHGNLAGSGGIGLGSWSYTGTQTVAEIVIDNNTLHDIGDVKATFDQDAHGVTINGSAERIWITHNEISYCSGDAVQIEAQANRRDKIHHIYYGKNHAHHNKQTGGWVKHATDVIFSQNTVHDHRAGNSSYGACIGFQYGPEQVWFIANVLHACDVGIGVSSNDPPGDGQYAYFIGNLIYDIHSPDPGNPYNAGAITVRGSTNRFVVNNTIVDYDSGVNMPTDGGKLEIQNNIFAGRSHATGYEIDLDGATVAGASLADNNLFFASAGSLRFNWKGSQTSLAALKTATGRCQSCLEGDPRFVNPAARDYRLQGGSPANGAAAVHGAYAAFLARYGIDLQRDLDGAIRPQGKWDIGAYEAP